MAVNNSTIEVTKLVKSFVLIVKRDNIKKFVARNCFSKKHINCTVLINKAKRFNSEVDALNFYNNNLAGIDNEISLVKAAPLNVNYSVNI